LTDAITTLTVSRDDTRHAQNPARDVVTTLSPGDNRARDKVATLVTGASGARDVVATLDSRVHAKIREERAGRGTW
jgi:hypothetical protein